MVEIYSNHSVGGKPVPNIILCNRMPEAKYVGLVANSDSFERSIEQSPIYDVSNDKFVIAQNDDEEMQFQEPMLGANCKALSKDVIKWGKRALTALEMYDLVDAYYERFVNRKNKNENHIS